MTVQQLIARARSASGRAIKYKLGKGGESGLSSLPADKNGQCDCSGFACWCLAMGRRNNHPLYKKFNNGWINTDAIVYDAQNATGYFRKLDVPAPGAFIVYPSPEPGVKVGHVGLITEVTVVDDKVRPSKVIHCSSTNSKTGDAIRETDPSVFNRPSTVFAWFEGLEEP